ncbi:MAG: hypothetical protein MUO31_02655 [Thermodesulfovibrionales bacterium]|nr:hypothetical protein [Thermodesulfovibrionales bacterium]
MLSKIDHDRVMSFLTNGTLYATKNTPLEQLKYRLRQIRYRERHHHEYTFCYYRKNPGDITDIRHIYVQELDRYFSYV